MAVNFASRPRFAGSAAVVALVLAALVFLEFSSNPYTPAGYVGYVTQGAVFGHARFVALQTGPTSSGRGWLLSAVNISVTPYTYDELFNGNNAVLSRDNLRVQFGVHVVWRVRPDRVADFVEHYSTLQPGDLPDKVARTAYHNFLQEPLRTFARDEVQKRNGLDIKDQITPIGQAIFERLIGITKETPFEVRSVVVGNIQYPEEVANAVALKLAATQELERKSTEIEIARKEKEKKVVEAEGIAQAMHVINATLTPAYLQWEAIKSQREMVNSPNHTTIYLPVGPMGVPLVGTFDTTTGEPHPAESAGRK